MQAFITKKDRYKLESLEVLKTKVNTKAKFLQDGNDKLASSIGNFSITPVLSCRNCSDCKDSCYARSPYEMRDNVKNRWDYNFQLSKTSEGREEIKDSIIRQITRSKSKTAVRIHVAGDFYSQEYLDMWTTIAKACPKMIFYAYTKSIDCFKQVSPGLFIKIKGLDFEAFKSLPNANLIYSVDLEGGKNYGNMKRISELLCQDYKLCPATIKDSGFGKNGKKCGRDCKICMTVGNDKVCFIQH